MPTVEVTPRPQSFPEGTDVLAFPKNTSDVERREGRVPIPDPTDSGTIAEGKVSITGDAGHYVLTGSVDEVQVVSLVGEAEEEEAEVEGGTFTLTFTYGGVAYTSPAIAYNASAATFKEKLEEAEDPEEEVEGAPLEGNIEVSGEAGGPWTVKFINELSGENLGALEGDGEKLEVAEEGEGSVAVETETQGAKGGAGGVQVTCLFYIPAE